MPLHFKKPDKITKSSLIQAICELYGVYYDNTSHVAFLDRMISMQPAETTFQAQLNKLFPNVDNVRLYAADFFIKLRRSDGFWRIHTTHIYRISSYKTGVIYADGNLTPVIKGAGNNVFLSSIESCRRDLSQAAAVAAFCDKLTGYELAINTIPGRVTLAVTIPEEHPYTSLWQFTPARSRSYYDARAKFQVVAKNGQVRPVAADLNACWELGNSPELLEYCRIYVLSKPVLLAINKILMGRLFPLIGSRRGRWVDIFGLSGKNVVIYGQHKRYMDLSYIPTMAEDMSINTAMADCIVQILIDPADTTEAKDRFKACLSLLSGFLSGDAESEDIVDFLTRAGVPVSNENFVLFNDRIENMWYTKA